MTKFDWDMDTRKARVRKHGSIPVWADEATLSAADERQIASLLDPMIQILNEFATLSRTQQRQRSSEFSYRLRKLAREAVSEATVLTDIAARQAVSRRADGLVQRFREALP